MAPPSTTTPRKDGKSDKQAQADMDVFLNTFYVQDDEVDRRHAVVAQPATSKSSAAKSAKAPRKRASAASKTPKTAKAEELSPSVRKSGRVTTKKRPFGSDTNEEDTRPSPAKVQKHTGRFVPINSQIPRAKKIEKKAVTKAPTAIDDDLDDTEVEDAVTPTSGGKKPKAKPFKGTTNTMGTSIEKPDDAPNNEPWKCANRNCTSGQTWHNRDTGKVHYGRKVLKETNRIDAEVWHTYCRKDYQRGTYRVGIQSAKAKCDYYIDNLEMQLLRIKLWRPEATFRVQLSKGAKDRLNEYYKELSKNNNDEAKAKRVIKKTPKVNAKGKVTPLNLENTFPIEYMKHFDDTFCADDQSFDDLDAVIGWIKRLVNESKIESMPPMEFLISDLADGETVMDPTYNYERWVAHEDGTAFVTPGTSEVDEDEATKSASDDEETEDEDEGLTDGESDSDSDEEERPPTPTPTQKERPLFTPCWPGARPLSSTLGAKPGSGLAKDRLKRELDAIDGKTGNSIDDMASKKQKQ